MKTFLVALVLVLMSVMSVSNIYAQKDSGNSKKEKETVRTIVTVDVPTYSKTVCVTKGNSFTISPWEDFQKFQNDWMESLQCISTSLKVEDTHSFSINELKTFSTRWLGVDYYSVFGEFKNGYYKTYQVDVLAVGNYTINGQVYYASYPKRLKGCIVYHVIVSEPKKVIYISIPNTLSLNVGDNYAFDPIISEDGAETTLTWGSSNKSVVSIDNNGKLVAHKVGNAIITCTAANGVSASCNVYVNPILIESIELSESEIELNVEERYKLTATILPDNATDKSLIYESSNEDVAFVGMDGTVIANSPGFCNITVKTKDESDANTFCLVRVIQQKAASEIKYYVDGELYQTEKNVVADSKISFIDEPTKDGYEFSGWKCDYTVMPDKDITVEGLFSLANYKITYNLDGGAFVSESPKTYTIESEDFYLSSAKRAGYNFVGWSGTDLSSPALFVTIPKGSTGDREYTANWLKNQQNTYTVTFVIDDEIYSSIERLSKGSNVPEIAKPSKDGFSLDGWYTANNTKFDFASDVVNDNINLYAYWIPIQYNISYNLNGGTAQNNTTYTIGSENFTLNNPTRNGYEFLGWTGTGLNTLSKEVVVYKGSIGDREYTAEWIEIVNEEEEKQYFISGQVLDKNSNPIVNALVSTTTTLPEITEQNSGEKTADGYYVTSDYYSVLKFNPSKKYLTQVGFQVWREGNPGTLTVVIADEDGNILWGKILPQTEVIDDDWTTVSIDNSLEVNVGHTYYLALKAEKCEQENEYYAQCIDSNEDRIYRIWSSDDCFVRTDENGLYSYPVTRNWAGTLYASYTGKTFNRLNFSEVLNNVSEKNFIENGDDQEVINALTKITVIQPTKTDYIIGESFDEAGLKVYAHYNDGTTIEVTDFSLNGFNSETIGDKKITVSYKGKTETFAITVGYNKHSVTYIVDGAIYMQLKNMVVHGSNMIRTNDPDKDGYTFDGWFTAAGAKYNFETGIVNDDVTLYAHWKPIEYSITYNLDGGILSKSNPLTYTIETEDITLNNPTKDGYIFLGWTGTGLTKQTMNAYIWKGSVGDREYVAQWRQDNGDEQPVHYYNAYITGKVLDSKSEPIANAIVTSGTIIPQISEQNSGTVTNNGHYIYSDQWTWLEFTPTNSFLTKVDFQFAIMGNPGTLDIAIATASKGNMFLWQTTISQDEVKNHDWTSVDIDYILEVVPGQNYILAFRAEICSPDDENYYAIYKDSNSEGLHKIYGSDYLVVRTDADGNYWYPFENNWAGTLHAYYDNKTFNNLTFNRVIASVSGMDFIENGEDKTFEKTLPSKHTISYIVDGEVYMCLKNAVVHGSRMIRTSDPEKDGYTFEGWFTADGEKYNFETGIVDGDVTLYAHWQVNKYTVKFVNNGKVLQSSEVEYGEMPIYNGAEPTKTATAEFTYKFSGWDSEIVEVADNVTYTAQFTETKNKYTIQFVNDGKVLQSSEIEYGEIPVYTGTEPSKPATAEFSYAFSGWDSEIGIVSGNTIYTAQFTAAKNKYTIQFVNDGKVLQTSEIEYGEMPVYNGSVPTKTATAEFTYKFSGWDSKIVAAKEDVTYTAQFTATKNKYTIQFVNDDKVLQTSEIEYGEMPVFNGAEPTKTATAEFTYKFSGWDSEIVAVQEDATYTAQFTETKNKYTIQFVNDGKVLQTSEIWYGEIPVYNGAEPTKTATAEFTYKFSGWDSEIVAVKEDATYTAQFTEKKNKYTIQFVKDGKVLQTSEIEYGEMPVFNGAEPTKDATSEKSFTFVGWSPEIVAVTSHTTYTAQFNEKYVVAIEINTSPGKTEYFKGEQLDVTEGEIIVKYNNGDNEVVALTKEMVSGFDRNKVGTQILTISFLGKTATFDVVVKAIEVESIALTTKPKKLEYFVGEEFSPDGGVITVNYNNGETKDVDITKEMVADFKSTDAGTQTLTVTYLGKTATFEVEVKAIEVESIELTTKPEKIDYVEGEDFMENGGVITVKYNNGTSDIVDLTKEMVSGFDCDKVGKQTLTVKYCEKTTKFDVTVNRKNNPETGIEDVDTKPFAFNLFPNPTTDFVKIEGNNFKEKRYFIFTSNGRIVKNGLMVDDFVEIDVSDLSSGLYIIRIDNQSAKFIKQ